MDNQQLETLVPPVKKQWETPVISLLSSEVIRGNISAGDDGSGTYTNS